MITKIKIENFKSIQSLDLELGRLNVFIGANGSGKSNILEGIAFGSVAAQDKLDKEFFKNRGIRVTQPKFYYSAFEKENNYREEIKITLQKDNQNLIDFKLHNLETTNKWMTQISSGGEQFINTGSKLGVLKDKTQFFEYSREEIFGSLLNFLIYAPENSCLRNFQDEGAIEPIGIMGEGLFKHLVEKTDILKTINENLRLLDWFDGFEIPNDLMFTEKRINIKDRYLKNAIEHFDQRSANEGFLYLLFYFTLFISEDTPKFFAIDNIDNAMNPKLGSELIRILAKLSKEHDKQVILTTHNPAILDGLDLEDDSQRLFVISRNKAGHTQAIRVPHRESEERLSTRFIRGSIGGLPKNF
jgi:predicted ATPase